MKETNLRILNASRDPINGLSHRPTSTIFHCTLQSNESLLQEEVTCDVVTSLRLRKISNPPPEITTNYKSVWKLEISCPVEISWVFALAPALPMLSLVRFGSSSFEYDYGDCKEISSAWLGKTEWIKELIVAVDGNKLETEEYNTRATITSEKILKYSSKYWTGLVQMDLVLPVACMKELEIWREGKKGDLREKGRIVCFKSSKGTRVHHSEVMSRVLKRSESCDGNGSEVCTSTTKSPKRDGGAAAHLIELEEDISAFASTSTASSTVVINKNRSPSLLDSDVDFSQMFTRRGK